MVDVEILSFCDLYFFLKHFILFCDLYFLFKHFINHTPKTSLVNSSAMQVLLVDTISAVFDPFLSGFLSVIRKEFEVPPYSQSVELGSQIQLRCHPPKGVPTPRVSVLKWYVCLLILCHLELPEANFQYRVSKNRMTYS